MFITGTAFGSTQTCCEIPTGELFVLRNAGDVRCHRMHSRQRRTIGHRIEHRDLRLAGGDCSIGASETSTFSPRKCLAKNAPSPSLSCGSPAIMKWPAPTTLTNVALARPSAKPRRNPRPALADTWSAVPWSIQHGRRGGRGVIDGRRLPGHFGPSSTGPPSKRVSSEEIGLSIG